MNSELDPVVLVPGIVRSILNAVNKLLNAVNKLLSNLSEFSTSNYAIAQRRFLKYSHGFRPGRDKWLMVRSEWSAFGIQKE